MQRDDELHASRRQDVLGMHLGLGAFRPPKALDVSSERQCGLKASHRHLINPWGVRYDPIFAQCERSASSISMKGRWQRLLIASCTTMSTFDGSQGI